MFYSTKKKLMEIKDRKKKELEENIQKYNQKVINANLFNADKEPYKDEKDNIFILENLLKLIENLNNRIEELEKNVNE